MLLSLLFCYIRYGSYYYVVYFRLYYILLVFDYHYIMFDYFFLLCLHCPNRSSLNSLNHFLHTFYPLLSRSYASPVYIYVLQFFHRESMFFSSSISHLFISTCIGKTIVYSLWLCKSSLYIGIKLFSKL